VIFGHLRAWIPILGFAVVAFFGTATAGESGISRTSLLNLEILAIAGYSREKDLSTPDRNLPRNAAGFEYFARFSGPRGDFLGANLQARLSYHEFPRGPDRWGLEIHNAWLQYRLGLGRNIAVGHIAPAFGLEPEVDTHAALLQTLAGQDVGFKKDWGLVYSGMAGPLDFQAGAQLGSGMGIRAGNGAHLLTARAAMEPAHGLRIGASALTGRVAGSMGHFTVPRPKYTGETTRKHRLGLDIQAEVRTWRFLAELSAGKNADADVFGALGEVRRAFPEMRNATLSVQSRYWSDDPGRSDRADAELNASLSVPIAAPLTARLGVFRDVRRRAPHKEDTRVFLQLYYFGFP
jgi:hypothetical protein